MERLLKVYVDPSTPNDNDNAYTIWTDLTKDQILSVNGVEMVFFKSLHCASVYVDPRYDEDEIINEIVELAERDGE